MHHYHPLIDSLWKSTMKKTGFLVLLAMIVLGLAACHQQDQNDHLSIAATAIPHGEILENVVKPLLAKEGITLDIHVMSDYVQPNAQVEQQQVSSNYFQTLPYLQAYNQDHGSHLVPIVGVHIEPMAAYSRRYHRIDALPDGAVITIPNDPSNNGRALLLLHQAGIIQLRDPSKPLSTVRDIVHNPKHLTFRELDAAMLSRVLDQVDMAIINTNYALDAHLNPLSDALLIESKDSPYVNYLVARQDNQNDPKLKMLARALTSPAVKEYIEQHYHGAVIPAF